MLALYHHGARTTAPPLVIAHGLFGSGRNWGSVAKALAGARHVVAVDMRNHGQSPWADSHGYDDMARDLAEVIDSLGGRADVLGHSMGGKAAMALALAAPDRLRKLIVGDIAPVAYGHDQRQHIAALRAVALDHVQSRAEAARQLAHHVEDRALQAFFLQSLDVKARAWRLNLDILDSEMPKILGFPEIAAQFTGPTLFLSGALSDYVRPEHRATIKAAFPAARFARIPDAGHWLHADRPDAFAAAVSAFLSA